MHRTGLMVVLKSSQMYIVPSCFITGTIGVAQSLVMTDSKIPICTSLINSDSTFGNMMWDTAIGLKLLGKLFV